ncbi:MAG: hypothetical protein R3E89_18850 [Thiolinea sp.]
MALKVPFLQEFQGSETRVGKAWLQRLILLLAALACGADHGGGTAGMD